MVVLHGAVAGFFVFCCDIIIGVSLSVPHSSKRQSTYLSFYVSYNIQ